MNALSAIEAFVRVAEAGSFRGAAARLGISPSAVSKAVARLEAELGATLLARTTRSVRLTTEGELFLEQARPALDQLYAGMDLVAQSREAPRGPVRLSLPLVLGDAVVAGLPRLLARYPGLQLDVTVTDREVRVVEEGFDVVVRIGDLVDSSLIGHRLRASRWLTAASPAYLAKHGTPARPRDLADHACLRFTRPSGGLTPWRFREGDRVEIVRVGERLRMDHGPLLVDAAIAGLGIVQAFDFMLADALGSGRLVQVLGAHSAAGPPVHALCPPGRQRTPRVRAVLDLLGDALGG